MAKKSNTKKDTIGKGKFKATVTTKKQPVKNNLLGSLNFSNILGKVETVVQDKAQEIAKNPPTPTPTPTKPTYDTSVYDNMIAAYEQKMKAEAEQRKKEKAAEYDSQAKSAYISKLQNQRTLNDNLARAGIRGGTTETTNARLLSNYENNRNQIAANKSSALTAIDRNADDMIFNYKQQQEAAKLQYIQAREAEARQIAETKRQEQWNAQQAQKEREWNAQQSKIERDYNAKQAQKERNQAKKETKKQNRETRYAATIGGYDTVKKCDAAIKAAKKSGQTWKIPYLRNQKAVIKAKNKNK